MTVSSPLSGVGGANGVEDSWEATRTAAGWHTVRHVGPSGVDSPASPMTGGVSSDHGYAFFHPLGSGGTLAPEGSTDYLSKPDGSFELTGAGSLGSERLAQGRYISPGGEHVIFMTGGDWCTAGEPCPDKQLEPDAPPTGTAAVYDRGANGPTHVVSLLPGNVTPAAGKDASYQGASADGSTVAFKVGGILYVRVKNQQTEEVAGGPATFGGLSGDGVALFYVSGGDIYRFDVASETTEQINSSGDGELVNVSADGSHAYFLSESQLDGSKGTVGQQNLYVWSVETESVRYVATVSPADAEGIPALNNWTEWVVSPSQRGLQGPGADPSRTTPDGHVLAFESHAQLTVYQNEGHTEVYRYDDRDESLVCVSCNPSEAPATSDARLQAYQLLGGKYASSVIVHNLSDDGSRIFFETSEALSNRDTDGINDVYEWHGEGITSTLDLISSGQSPSFPLPTLGEPPFRLPQNVLLSVSPDGSNVIFFAQEALAAEASANGALGIYDARVDGGFPPPPAPSVCVEEEACRGPVGIGAEIGGPQSEGDLGKQNFKPRKPCRRTHTTRHGKRDKHCVKRHRKTRAATSVSSDPGAVPQAEGPKGKGVAAPIDADAGPPAKASHSAASLGTELEPFEIDEAAAEVSTNAAGYHPDFVTKVVFNHFFDEEGIAVSLSKPENVSVALPPGMIGNPTAIPACTTGSFLQLANCSVDSQVGIVKVLPANAGVQKPFTEPLYNLDTVHNDEIARLGFWGVFTPVFIDVSVRTASDYRVVATVHGAPGWVAPVSVKTVIWGDPPDPSHDKQRLTALEGNANCETACTAPGGKRSSSVPPTAFLTNPTACQEEQVDIEATSYQFPGQLTTATAPMEPTAGCGEVPFDATLDLEPTSQVAGAPTGLRATLHMPQVSDVESRFTSALREAKVTLPEGMTISASAAAGLEACSAAQVHFHEEVDAECPDGSKIGSATIVSPDLPRPIEGGLFVRTSEPGHLFRLWLAIDELGLHVKLPAEIATDPTTGQITTTFSDTPQVPVEEVSLDIWGGPRAPLKNPTDCGTHAAQYEFSPWSGNPPVKGEAHLIVDQGCNRTFDPKLSAGTADPRGGHFSPLVFSMFSGDEQENLRSLDVKMPPGLLAKLSGVPLCPEPAAETGDCPADSQIGEAKVAVGTGPSPLWLPEQGKAPISVYLAGPYGPAPYSLVVNAPAQAGPFDLGTVVTRAGIDIEPETGRAVVHAELPQIVSGVPIVYRTLHLLIDRPNFVLNPTNCEPLAFASTITSVGGVVAQPTDRFQVGGCKELPFRPRFRLALSGGTRRGDYPALTAKLRTMEGDANFARVAVTLPHSEFLAQEHIRTICTRVQFAADQCPRGAVYGYAEARTPLLDEPLRGPVYLRSSSHPLPDLVIALRGQIEVDLVGRIDSKNGGIRTVFESVPDAPVSFFKLQMKGGRWSLLKNSANLCQRARRAGVSFIAQNGRTRFPKPALKPDC